ncbi:hypothetical protein FPOAC1_005850 [Fusarium poae]|uniref:hypothetical protein n=1 Tax=Fusarium poae TaxID=36050 RepID=UPI001CEBE0C3|nr:hypothetical protein FPOAC1_005850 [Fusarium poae]KAG8672574.1 hypothetical protein FPOAC1_005850 [Fusarium poae]
MYLKPILTPFRPRRSPLEDGTNLPLNHVPCQTAAPRFSQLSPPSHILKATFTPFHIGAQAPNTAVTPVHIIIGPYFVA